VLACVGAQEQPVLGPELQRPDGILRGLVGDLETAVVIGEHPISRLDALLPGNIARPATPSVAV
jgi:hypothetical protein